jgi:hypothetical protein
MSSLPYKLTNAVSVLVTRLGGEVGNGTEGEFIFLSRMRETRLSGSVEGVVSNHDPYSDYPKWVFHLPTILSLEEVAQHLLIPQGTVCQLLSSPYCTQILNL